MEERFMAGVILIVLVALLGGCVGALVWVFAALGHCLGVPMNHQQAALLLLLMHTGQGLGYLAYRKVARK